MPAELIWNVEPAERNQELERRPDSDPLPRLSQMVLGRLLGDPETKRRLTEITVICVLGKNVKV